MKKYLTYTVLVVVCTVLGVYVWFGEIRKDEARQAASDDAKRLFAATIDDIATIKVRYAYDTFVLSRGAPGEWLISAPIRAVADPVNVERYAGRILELEKKNTVSGIRGRLAEFGLARPEIDVTFLHADGSPAGEIRFGNTTPGGDMVYVLCGSDSVAYLIDHAVMPEVRKTAADLRDRGLCGIEREAVNRLEVKIGESPVVLRKASGGIWRIIVPVQAVARQRTVEMILDKLAYSKAMFFIDDHNKDFARYGLADPRVTVTAWDRQDRMSVLMLGDKERKGDHYYARRLDRNEVILVERYVPDVLRANLAALRDSALVRLMKRDITGLTVGVDGGVQTWQRQEDDTWRRYGDNGAVTGTAPQALTDEILEALVRLRYVRIESDVPRSMARYGLEQPAVTLKVSGESGELDTVDFGKTTGLFVFCRPGTGRSVYTVSGELSQKLQTLTEIGKN